MTSKQEVINKYKDRINDLKSKSHTVINLDTVMDWLKEIEKAQ